MSWQNQLKKLEQEKKWDEAIEFMQQVIAENPDSMDAYLFMNYLLMNLLVEEDHNEYKHNYYELLTKQYFDESYAKFSNNPEFLFCTGKMAFMSVWLFGIESEDAMAMLEKAYKLDPDNQLYQWGYYIEQDFEDPKHRNNMISYAKSALQPNSPARNMLEQKGSLGKYLLELLIEWCEKVVSLRLSYR